MKHLVALQRSYKEGPLYTHIYKYLVFFPTNTGGASKNPQGI